jgi:O-antigen/teichoic acid export membrane protein|tara:strand:+ start:704 stop:2164 length:1461 start_codon:yes stop_codon:yes gene_type:complete
MITFVLAFVTVFASLAFNLIITRTLTPNEYGMWGLINVFFIYAVIAEPAIGYWVVREIARKEESGRSAIISSGVLSIGGILVFIIASLFIGKEVGLDLNILLLAVIIIPPKFINGTLGAINQSWKPHTISYGIIAMGITQIPMALLFVYHLEWGISGLILSVLTGLLVSNIILGWFAREKINKAFNIKHIKKWTKLSWLPLYFVIPGVIYKLDIIIFTIITSSVIGLAYWAASLSISTIVSHSGLIARAMYPKILMGEGDGFLQSNFTQFFYFAIPLTAIVIVFSKPALFVLNPVYAEAYLIPIFIALRVFFTTFSGVIENTLLGKDEVDIEDKSNFKDYMRSNLFLMPTLEMTQHVIYIVLLIIGLIILVSTSSIIELIIYWAILSLVVRIPFTIYRLILLQKIVEIQLEHKIIAKYIITSVIIFGTAFFITDEFLVYDERLFEFLPNFLLFTIISIVGYFISTYLIDFRTRNLVHAVFKEIKKK